jgi:hypothetical protein
MKSIYILITLVLVSCTTKQTQVAFQPNTPNRTPSQVTGNYGNMFSANVSTVKSIYVKFNTTEEVINQRGRVISTQQKTWSPCAMEYVDVRYNGQNTAGSCTGFTFGEGLSASRLGVKINVSHEPEMGYTSEFQIGVGDTAYTIVKRLEDNLDLSKPFYNKFDGQLVLSEEMDGKNLKKVTLNSVELANSHYYAAGAKFQKYEAVNFQKIADDFIAEQGGLEKLMQDLMIGNRELRFRKVTTYSKDLNKTFRKLKSAKKYMPADVYAQLRDSYLDLKKTIDETWDNVIKDSPELSSKRIKIVADE